MHQTEGVAVMAHVGGFLFGFAAATLIQKTGYEARSLAPSVQQKTTWTQHPGTELARAALERADNAGAAQAYRTVLPEQPLDREGAVGPARTVPTAARALPDLAPQMLAQIEAAAGGRDRPAAAPAAAAGPAAAVRVLAGKLIRVAEDALHVEVSPGKTRRIEFKRLVGVAAGVVATAEGSAILTDFVLSWGNGSEGPSALRIPGAQLGLGSLFPGVPSREAYSKFLAHVLARIVGDPLPSRDALAAGA